MEHIFYSLRLIPLFGAPKLRPSKIERWAEHRSWVAAACWADATIKGAIVSVVGGGVGEELRLGGLRGGGRLLIGLGGELSDKRIKIEGAMGV